MVWWHVPETHDSTDGGLHLHGRDVLALPPEGVARPVLEVEPAQGVHHQDVTGPAACLGAS